MKLLIKRFKREQLAKLFLFFILICSATCVHAASENIGKANMVQCYQEYCVRLSSSHLQKSSFADIYAFSKANIFVSNKDKSKNRLFTGVEGSFDPTIGRFYLSKKGEEFEYVIDTKFKKVIEFKVN